ncbi:MAG: DRTGG domain-containing protein, partial [Dehalococcoidia bacterium]|nr:DRTGG domain-containing protein [Dehalococcoidia bacterium]
TEEALCPQDLAAGYQAVAKGKDVVVIEGMSPGDASGPNARVVMVAGYPQRTADEVVELAGAVGPHLAGVVVNAVPRRRMLAARESWTPTLVGRGVKVLGFLPQDRTLFSLSVADLAQHLDGNIINHQEKTADLVEDVMVGVLWVDPTPLYFSSKKAKAVLTRGDRPDVHLGALETPTRCLILSKGVQPHPNIYYRAEDKGVPIMVTAQDTAQAMQTIDEAVIKTRFRQEQKLPRLMELVEDNLDLEAFAGLLKA